MVLKVFPKGDFLGLLICCSQKNSDQVTLKIPFVAISFKSNLRMTGLKSDSSVCSLIMACITILKQHLDYRLKINFLYKLICFCSFVDHNRNKTLSRARDRALMALG